MNNEITYNFKIAAKFLLTFMLIIGLLYTWTVTGLAQLLFPLQANGSMIQSNGHNVGSALIGQNFTADKYFWGRPSATVPYAYNAAASGGSNLGPSNPELLSQIQKRMDMLQRTADNEAFIPVELVTTSASGLDPHINPRAAMYQVARIAKARNIAPKKLIELIDQHTEDRTFYVLGEPRVNVLELNLDLDRLT